MAKKKAAVKKKVAKKTAPEKGSRPKGRKLKLKKLPKKPKRSASVESLKKFFKRCDEIKRENAKKQAVEKMRQVLLKKLKNYKP
jgi:hypothetical protein